jgi:hypothetical protein
MSWFKPNDTLGEDRGPNTLLEYTTAENNLVTMDIFVTFDA